MSEKPQRVHVHFNSWAGKTTLLAEIVGVTPKRYRVKWLENTPRRVKGSTGLVPKSAVSPMHGESLP